MDEMRLIEVAAVESDAGPIDRLAAGDLAKYILEAAHTAEEFGCHANVLFEEFDEAAGAEAGFVGDVGDSCGCRLSEEIVDGIFDDGLAVKHARRVLQ